MSYFQQDFELRVIFFFEIFGRKVWLFWHWRQRMVFIFFTPILSMEKRTEEEEMPA